jgi:large subunit ribosomal protein L5
MADKTEKAADKAKPDKAEKPKKEEGAAKADKAEKAAKPEGGKDAKGGGKPADAKAGDKGKGGGKPGAKGGDKGPPAAAIKRTTPPRLQTLYKSEVIPRLMKEFGHKNVLQVPKLVKITVNMGLGEAIGNPKIIDHAVEELRSISGQQPVVTKAKKSIATFKLREGQKIGAMVTLRRERMWEFFDRLVSMALPRVRDFKGISPRSFDGRGNFSMGVREQIIFPEINYDKIDKIKGMNISIGTTAKTDDEGRALLKYLGMPFRS